jgi:hypothetical protein
MGSVRLLLFMRSLWALPQIRLAPLRPEPPSWLRTADIGGGARTGSIRAPPRLGFDARERHMLDLVFVILGAVLFLGALVYARACANI